MTALARSAGRALVLGLVAVYGGVMPAAAQSLSPAEQLRDAVVATLTSAVCLGKNKTAFVEGKWTSLADGYACAKALRDALAVLVLTSGQEPEPPAGSAAVVTCTYSLTNPSPPQCVAAARE